MLKAKDLKDQSHDDLQALLLDKRRELYEIVNKREREKKRCLILCLFSPKADPDPEIAAFPA